MLELVSFYFVSAILGIMVFFSFVVAPVIFTTLNEENARIFIRKIFPIYYTVNLALSFLATAIYVFLKSYKINFYLILTVFILFLVSNYILMPLINKFRDNDQQKKFKFYHFISVFINFLQILFLLIFLF